MQINDYCVSYGKTSARWPKQLVYFALCWIPALPAPLIFSHIRCIFLLNDKPFVIINSCDRNFESIFRSKIPIEYEARSYKLLAHNRNRTVNIIGTVFSFSNGGQQGDHVSLKLRSWASSRYVNTFLYCFILLNEPPKSI